MFKNEGKADWVLHVLLSCSNSVEFFKVSFLHPLAVSIYADPSRSISVLCEMQLGLGLCNQ